ncbi:hypothetical protein [Pyrobaculum ferrireducens]|uniref:Uncharacterized protein n=1 Tax=Pyrobaculum ferrireducens TaxID=1104324 RepID=G7VGB6_9CREN|nr:hypothetical protein [Pyrobaculum ferrireducens]AET31827.1 hypothetical protein P186_0373 [Pyrobaculum ferrireducens]
MLQTSWRGVFKASAPRPLEAFVERLSAIAPRGSAFRVAYDICGGSGSCIETIRGAVKWAVERGLVEGVVKLAGGWLVPASWLPSLKAAVLMYKAVVEGEGKLGVKKGRGARKRG